MEHYPIAEHAFYVLAFLAVGLWTILSLGWPGFTTRGVPAVPPSWGRGIRGRVIGGLLIAIGSTFVILSLLGLALLLPRLG
jgi:hypothetical protein